MLKKIAMGALLTGLVAVLILGAVIRTNAVSGESAGETGRRGRTTETVAADAGVENYGQGGRWAQEAATTETAEAGVQNYGQGGRWAQEAATTETAEAGVQNYGQGGRWEQESTTTETLGRGGRWAQAGAVNQVPAGQGAGGLNSVLEADVQPDEWRTVEGTVVSAANDLIEIETAAGEIVTFEGRPLSFALEQGFSLQLGDAVAVDGFDEDGEFKIGKVTDLGNGASVTLRDANGRPGWSGRGWRS